MPAVEDQRPTSSNTKAEISEYLDDHGIEHAPDATKSELLDLVP